MSRKKAHRGDSGSPWFGGEASAAGRTRRTSSAHLAPATSWWVGCEDFYATARQQLPRLLEAAAGNGGIPIWLICRAAEIVSDQSGCEMREAWDRLAFNLERM